jgi:hypothetical protein
MAITDEIWWAQESVPSAMATLRTQLLAFFQLPPANIGIKGNTTHTRGYHRSYAWVKESQFSTNRTYSVSETHGNRNPGNINWLCAMDITINAARLIPMCKRVDEAVRSGTLEKITEWYGNDDGDNRVDGYDNVRNRVASSDPSHLWHLHLSFDRGRAGEDHQDLFEVLTGEDMNQTQDFRLEDVWRMMLGLANAANSAPIHDSDGQVNLTPYWTRVNQSEPAPVDVAALVVALEPEIRRVIREELNATKLTGAT